LLVGLGPRILKDLRILHGTKGVLLSIRNEARVDHWHATIAVLPLLHALSYIAVAQVVIGLIHCWGLLMLSVLVEQCVSSCVNRHWSSSRIVRLILIIRASIRLPFEGHLVQLHELVAS
jgi:hypothetical protein